MIRKFNLPSICLLLFLFSYSFCFSQSDKFSLGIKSGISIPDLKASGDNPVSKGWSSRLGPYAGAIAGLKLSERFSLQAELNYASQGGKNNGPQAIPTSEFTQYIPDTVTVPAYVYANYKSVAKLNYIELPVLIKLNFSLNQAVSFFVNVGPYAGYLINAKIVTSGSSKIYFDENLTQALLPSDVTFDQTSDIRPCFEKFYWPHRGGIGIDFRVFDESKMVLTADGNNGLIKIRKDKANRREQHRCSNNILRAHLIHL